MPKDRFCKYCECSLNGTRQRTCCLKKCCLDKRDDERRAYMRKESAVQRMKTRAISLSANPRHCEHCGNSFTVLDNLSLPVCQRPECLEFWAVEKETRQKKRNANWRNAPKAKEREKVFMPEPGDFNQAVWEREQMEARQYNGRICRDEDCNAKCKGPNFYCDKCRAKNYQTASVHLVEGAWSGVDAGGRRSAGTMG